MTISTGDKLPEAALMTLGEDGRPEQVALADKTAGRKVIIFGLPGAFTPTCSSAHLPSFIRTRAAFAEKGVDEIICVSVNDPFVMAAWSSAAGADAGGVTLLADPDSAFTTAIGMNFDFAPSGLHGRSIRYAMLVEDGEVRIIQREAGPGVCDATAGEGLLAAM